MNKNEEISPSSCLCNQKLNIYTNERILLLKLKFDP